MRRSRRVCVCVCASEVCVCVRGVTTSSLQVREIEIEAPQLHSLSLASCKVLLQLKVVAPALSSLNLHGCRLLDTLLLHSPRLTVVNMYGCLAVGDRAVHTLLTAAEDSLQEVVLDGLVKVECLRLAAPKVDGQG